MQYFFAQQDDIPAGMGYPLFGPTHLISLALTLAFVVISILLIKRKNDATQRTILKWFPIIMVIMEVAKDLYLYSIGRFGIGYLPLHMCSMGFFVFLLREFLPFDLMKDLFGEVAFVLILPGGIAALLFADWAALYPALNIFSIHSYIWHGMLIIYPLMLKIRKDISPSIKHIHYVLLFLCFVVPPIYLFDKKYNCNYMFVNWPIEGSPLSFFASFMGVPGYLVGYAALVIAGILCVYAVSALVDRRV